MSPQYTHYRPGLVQQSSPPPGSPHFVLDERHHVANTNKTQQKQGQKDISCCLQTPSPLRPSILMMSLSRMPMNKRKGTEEIERQQERSSKPMILSTISSSDMLIPILDDNSCCYDENSSLDDDFSSSSSDDKELCKISSPFCRCHIKPFLLQPRPTGTVSKRLKINPTITTTETKTFF